MRVRVHTRNRVWVFERNPALWQGQAQVFLLTQFCPGVDLENGPSRVSGSSEELAGSLLCGCELKKAEDGIGKPSVIPDLL